MPIVTENNGVRGISTSWESKHALGDRGASPAPDTSYSIIDPLIRAFEYKLLSGLEMCLPIGTTILLSPKKAGVATRSHQWHFKAGRQANWGHGEVTRPGPKPALLHICTAFRKRTRHNLGGRRARICLRMTIWGCYFCRRTGFCHNLSAGCCFSQLCRTAFQTTLNAELCQNMRGTARGLGTHFSPFTKPF